MDEWLVALIAAGVLAVSAVLGAPLTAGVLRLAARSPDAGGGRHEAGYDPDDAAPPTRRSLENRGIEHAATDQDDDGPTGARARGALRGGLWIGLLERLAITATLIVGYPAGVAFVIAVKGLGRYPELRENPGASERFVIGTLTSMLWATLVGGLFRALVP